MSRMYVQHSVSTSSHANLIFQVTMDVNFLLKDAKVSVKDNIPSIKHDAVPFSQVKALLAHRQSSTEELDIYELLHVLFDDYEDEFTSGLSRQQQQENQPRIRRDRLSKFLAELVWQRHGDRIKASPKINAASAAVLQLTAKDIHAACDALMQEKNFHLTLLVAQIEQADSSFQNDIAAQISAWREQNILSEMSEDIRALYEILSGNTSIAQGKQNVPVEHRATTFAISGKYELDWVQAFALCLWYGKHKNEDVAEVVADFQDKLGSNLESATPVRSDGHVDPLWVVLKLFASGSAMKGKGRTTAVKVEKPVVPQALSALSQAWDSKRTFHLHHAITATISGVSTDQEKANDLAMALAFEHSARGNITGAAFALLHLADPAKRAQQLEKLLNHHADALPAPSSSNSQSSPLWTALTTALHIPTAWIYHAKALYARSCNEALAEFHYLIAAKDCAQAHACLLRRIAPRLVIDEDWEGLRDVLAQFGEDPAQKVDAAISALSGQDNGPEWKNGGQVYADFAELMTLMDQSTSGGRGSGQDANEVRKQKTAFLERLQSSLTSWNARFKAADSSSGSQGRDLNKDRDKLEERVAFCEMGKAVAGVIELDSEDGLGDKVRHLFPFFMRCPCVEPPITDLCGLQKAILDLPLTADARLRHARALGVEYYHGVMALAH